MGQIEASGIIGHLEALLTLNAEKDNNLDEAAHVI